MGGFRLIAMETENLKDSVTHEGVTKVGDAVITQVRRSERHLLKNLKWISIAVAMLYVLGYVWRSSYYERLGIPHSLLDFPFPEILVPQSFLLIAFASTIVWPFVCRQFYDYFIKARRKAISESIGISCPIQDIISFLGEKNPEDKNETNIERLLSISVDYIQDIKNKTGKFTNDDYKNLREVLKGKLNGLSEPMKESVINYLIHIISLEKENLRETIDTTVTAAAGMPPEGFDMPNAVFYFLFIIFVAWCLYYGLYWHIIIILLGHFLGIAVYKLSYVEDRTQFWRILWLCIIIACCIQYFDARMTAVWNLKHGNFPVVLKLKLNDSSNTLSSAENERELAGILFGFFKGKYFVASNDKIFGHKLTILDSERVQDMEIIYSRWLEKNIEKSRKELRELADRLSELEKEGESIIKKSEDVAKEMGDPNALDNIKRDIEEKKIKINEMRERIGKRLEN